MGDHKTTATMETVPVATPAIAAPGVNRREVAIQVTRARVTNLVKRLRNRRNPTNAQQQLPRLSATNSFGPLDVELKSKSEISGITDTEYGDDFSWDDGKSTKKKHGDKNRNFETSFQPSARPKKSFAKNNISNPTDPSLSESLGSWCDALSSLAKSEEMNSFIHSSNKLAISAAHKSLDTARNVGEIAVHTALLPVTLPLHITASATGLVFKTGSSALHYFCDNLVPIVIDHAINIPPNSLLTDSKTKPGRFQGGSELKKKTVPPEPTKAKPIQQTSYDDDFLDRLRLDLHLSTSNDIDEAVFSVDTDSLTLLINATANCSKFLLWVDDVNVVFNEKSESEFPVRLNCVDLDKESSIEKLTFDALSQLAQQSMDIALSNKFVLNMLSEIERNKSQIVNPIRIDWKPLGQTRKDYPRMLKLTKAEYYDELCDRVCTWTGKYFGEKYHGSDNAFFMAQGVVGGSPKEIFDLLWDSQRTKEYNKHCVYREDVFSVLDDDPDDDSDEAEKATNKDFCGAKIISSETKIPFTKMSVPLSAVMCAKLLGDRPEDGYLIFSRSLNHGHKGYHSSKTPGHCKAGKNEVILGINIMRPVPGRPELSDLISISQVDASILPPFLRPRVGIMAVEDFFKNVRKSLQSSR
jgi:hypothetical protein